MFKKALQIQRQQLGDEHEHVAATHIVMGLAYRELGELDQALECLQKGLEIQRRLCGADVHQGVARALDSLGLVYQKLGRYPDALEKHNEALRILRKELGDAGS